MNKVHLFLEESFNPINDLIYDIQLLKLWQLCKKATGSKIHVYAIKTDCLLVNEDTSTLKNVFTFNNVIGGVKYEVSKHPINKNICMVMNELIEFKQPIVNIVQINDEYDKKK